MAKNLKVLPRKVKEFDQQIVPDGAVDLKVPSEPQKKTTNILHAFLLGGCLGSLTMDYDKPNVYISIYIYDIIILYYI